MAEYLTNPSTSAVGRKSTGWTALTKTDDALCDRGVYFACVVCHEDKILVTTEEFPPVVEVDDTYPASVNNDFHWLMKVRIAGVVSAAVQVSNE